MALPDTASGEPFPVVFGRRHQGREVYDAHGHRGVSGAAQSLFPHGLVLRRQEQWRSDEAKKGLQGLLCWGWVSSWSSISRAQRPSELTTMHAFRPRRQGDRMRTPKLVTVLSWVTPGTSKLFGCPCVPVGRLGQTET